MGPLKELVPALIAEIEVREVRGRVEHVIDFGRTMVILLGQGQIPLLELGVESKLNPAASIAFVEGECPLQ